jgi:hypothetical protein
VADRKMLGPWAYLVPDGGARTPLSGRGLDAGGGRVPAENSPQPPHPGAAAPEPAVVRARARLGAGHSARAGRAPRCRRTRGRRAQGPRDDRHRDEVPAARSILRSSAAATWRAWGDGVTAHAQRVLSLPHARWRLPRSPLAALWAPLRVFAGVGRVRDRPGAHGRSSRLRAATSGYRGLTLRRLTTLRRSPYCMYL